MKEPSFDAKWIGTCAGVALALAVASYVALKWIATPADYATRMAAVQAQALRAEGLAAKSSGTATLGKGAVCEGFEEAQLGQVREAVESAGRTEGLQSLQVALGAPLDAGARIAPLTVTLRADGGYDKVAGFLDRLGRITPKIFVDSADLAPSATGASLSLTGRVFCWTRG